MMEFYVQSEFRPRQIREFPIGQHLGRELRCGRLRPPDALIASIQS